MKKLLGILLLTVLLFLAVPQGIVKAVEGIYKIPFTVNNTSGTSYTNLSLIISVDNQLLISNGYLNSSGTNFIVAQGSTVLQATITNDKLVVVIPSLPANSSASIDYYLGTTSAAWFPLSTGVGGYVTTLDATALELGSDFELGASGYIGASAGADKNIVFKDGAVRVYISGANTLSAVITPSYAPSGTAIHNVTELQAMLSDPTADYYLANDIDASATSGWNDGAGFIPINNGYFGTVIDYRGADSDSLQTGTWTTTGGAYYTEVDEFPHDNDTSYIGCTVIGEVIFNFVDFNVPAWATNIEVNVGSYVKKISGTPLFNYSLRIDGNTYYSVNTSVTQTSVYDQIDRSWATNPATSSAWTVNDVNNLLDGFGVKCTATGERFTNIYVEVEWDCGDFLGTFDGQGHSITGLYINRPWNDNSGACTGLFGTTYQATIKNVTLVNPTIFGGYYSGSLVGSADDSIISNCSVTGGSITGYSYTGGLIGEIDDTTVSSCSSSADVEDLGDYDVGGLIGDAYHICVIQNCYATGNVTGTSVVSGLVGELYPGSGKTISVTNCYATGLLTNTETPEDINGLFAIDTGTTVTSCYWDTETTGASSSEGGTGKTTAQMKTQATYSAWDFVGAWAIAPLVNDGYPYLVGGISVSCAVTSATHIIKVVANSTTLKLYLDGVEKDSENLNGASVTNNANNYILDQTNVMPYMDYFKMTIGGTLIVWYQPNTIISGTTLPDRQGTAQNGTITWGTNPGGITITTSPLVVTTPAVGSSTGYNPAVPPFLPQSSSPGWYSGSEGSGIPLYPFFKWWSDSLDVPIGLLWSGLGIIFALAVMTIVHRSSHTANERAAYMMSGIASWVTLLFFSVIGGGIIPLWVLLTHGATVLTGMVGEKSPTV